MKTNQDYKNAALAALKGNWGPAVLLTLVMMGVSTVASLTGDSAGATMFQLAVSICVAMPLTVGMFNAFRGLLHGQTENFVHNAFSVSFNNWVHNVGGMLLTTVYVLLWTLLLIVPGIIKGISYGMTPFILAEKPELSAQEAIDLSMKMMEGHKMEFFKLWLSFIGWCLLGILTLGIGCLWLVPYMYAATAAFYEDVKAEYENTQVVEA